MKKIIFFLIASACLLVNIAHAQNMPDGSVAPGGTAGIPLPYTNNGTGASLKYNFVRTWVPLIPVTNAGFNLNSSNCKLSTAFSNGWGEPVQSTARVGSYDVIKAYDNREMLEKADYLPFSASVSGRFKQNLFSEQKNWYAGKYAAEGDNAYTRTISLASGDDRSAAAYRPGAAFTGNSNGTKVSAFVNTAADDILRLEYVSGQINPTQDKVYAAGELMVKKTEGQHGALSYEYTNRSGQTICKRVNTGNSDPLTTYYLYDDYGRITWIVTPKAVEATNNWTGNGPCPLELCFGYTYNEYGQVIERTIPEKNGPELTVYDSKHRPVLSQTALLRAAGKWAWQVYDNHSRVVFSGFITSTNDRETWQSAIDNAGVVASGTLLYYLLGECNDNYPNTLTDCEINEYNYYDNYNFPQGLQIYGRTFDSRHNTQWQLGGLYPAPQPMLYARGLLTAKLTRVLDNPHNPRMVNPWVSTVLFYDQKAQMIQAQTLNAWNRTNWDVTTTRPQFDGQPGMIASDYNWMPNTHKPLTRVIDWFTYAPGNNNKLVSVSRSMDGQPSVSLSAYQYDELGRVKSKNIGTIETQKYTYDIAGRLNGINRDYVYDQTVPDVTFGCEIAYDHGFKEHRYDGSISGVVWRGAGSKAHQRSYGYLYDAAGRMTGADFYDHDISPLLQVGTPYWDNSIVDYTVSGITYDANGNMLSMKQRGVALSGGVMQPVDIDDLNYSYLANSNALSGVSDAVSANYNLGDFLDAPRNYGADYSYDDDGNLTRDNNKGISSIKYNAQDLPLSVQGTQGSVDNIYDASGTLLEKKITDKTGHITTYSYIGPVVFKDLEPEYVLNSEGRTRWLSDTLVWRYDFFIKDHLGNVRTVVGKDPPSPLIYVATYEPGKLAAERMVFEKVAEVSAANTTASASVDNQQVAVLDGNDPDRRIGTSLLLKVMAGDKFHLSAETNYEGDETAPQSDPVAGSEMMGALLGALTGGATGIEGGEGGSDNAKLVNQLFGSDEFVSGYQALNQAATDPSLPQSYLSYVFFDQDMHLVPEESGVLQVSSAANGNWALLEKLEDLVASKNGYLGVFTSNADHRWQVRFNDLKVTYSRGRLLEEQHYYPHGLVAVDGSNNPVANRFLYQGKELQDEAGLQLYDFHARQYDPQIGRFWGIDPMDEFPSGYTGMGNNPANMTDPTGMQTNYIPTPYSSSKPLTIADQWEGTTDVWGMGGGSFGLNGTRSGSKPFGFSEANMGQGYSESAYADFCNRTIYAQGHNSNQQYPELKGALLPEMTIVASKKNWLQNAWYNLNESIGDWFDRNGNPGNWIHEKYEKFDNFMKDKGEESAPITRHNSNRGGLILTSSDDAINRQGREYESGKPSGILNIDQLKTFWGNYGGSGGLGAVNDTWDLIGTYLSIYDMSQSARDGIESLKNKHVVYIDTTDSDWWRWKRNELIRMGDSVIQKKW